MKVLIVGSGAREHALAWKIAQSPLVTQVCVAPGNDGMPAAFERWEQASFQLWAKRARDSGVDLAVIGPDNFLADGIVDIFSAHGVAAFGPTAAAARIESSKAYAKALMKKAGVSTALAYTVTSQGEGIRAVTELCARTGACVVKADGLAFGKGVDICESQAEGEASLRRLFAISPALIVEERLRGEELSWFAFCDGKRAALWEPARDYKRLHEGEKGPNTGGMGAFSPVEPFNSDPDFAARVRAEVFDPILAALAQDRSPFQGLLYAGLMIEPEAAPGAPRGIKVLEFNSRFGDPETQALLPRMSGDIVPWLLACAKGDLSQLPERVPFSRSKSIYVVAASRGYPLSSERGKVIDIAPGTTLESGYFFSGVRRKSGGQSLETTGGRIFGALGIADTWIDARVDAYAKLQAVSFEGKVNRTDIGWGLK